MNSQAECSQTSTALPHCLFWRFVIDTASGEFKPTNNFDGFDFHSTVHSVKSHPLCFLFAVSFLPDIIRMAIFLDMKDAALVTILECGRTMCWGR